MASYRTRVLGVLGLCLGAAAASAQTPYLVRDINTMPGPSKPFGFIDMGGFALFGAIGAGTGRELYRTDGTAAQTVLVADICPGPCHGFPSITMYSGSIELQGTVIGGRLFFAANDGVHGVEPWVSDGTTAGTFMLADIDPGNRSSLYQSFKAVELAGRAYFIAGHTMYQSDGTTAGTLPVPGIAWANDLTGFGGALYFRGTDGIYRSGGSGATLEVPLPTGVKRGLVEAGGRLYFNYSDVPGNSEPWSSDGTPAGTGPLGDLMPGSRGSDPGQFTASGGLVYFTATDATAGEELWATNGTPAGTGRVLDIYPGAGGSSPTDLTDLGGRLFFRAADPARGSELWQSDGTPGGTAPVIELPGLEGYDPYGLLAVAGTLYFNAFDPAAGYELHASDGTAAGTRRVADIRPGPGDGPSGPPSWGAGRLLFAADDSGAAPQLWQSDGTDAGTSFVTVIHAGTAGSSLSDLHNLGGVVVCTADDGAIGREPWLSDGSQPGTRPLDLEAGPASSGTRILGAVPGGMLLSRNDPVLGRELWRSDGTVAGTTLVLDLNPGPDGSHPQLLARSGRRAFLVAGDGIHGWEPWLTDGTPGGTAMVMDLCPGTCSSNPGPPIELPGGWLLAAHDGVERRLWRTDGTPAGTALVSDLLRDVGPPVRLGGEALFEATDGTETGLWKSDGTTGGTSFVAAIPTTTGMVAAGGRLFLFTLDEQQGIAAVWISDGTAAGTGHVADVDDYQYVETWVETQGRVLFVAQCEVWISDGTPGGTGRVCPGCVEFVTGDTATCSPAPMVSVGPRVYFSGYDDAHGQELWVTDGTAAGTSLAGDITPGTESGAPDELTLSGSRLFFTADDSVHGRELWALDLAPAGSRRLLLRNDDVTRLDPPTPALGTLLPLDAVRDAYAQVAPGDLDPELSVLADAARPLVLYALDGQGQLLLAKSELGRVKISF